MFSVISAFHASPTSTTRTINSPIQSFFDITYPLLLQ